MLVHEYSKVQRLWSELLFVSIKMMYVLDNWFLQIRPEDQDMVGSIVWFASVLCVGIDSGSSFGAVMAFMM